MWKDFKEFAVKGTLIDTAVGIMIGVAFGKIISSLVNDIIMPPLSLLFGKIDFTNLFFRLSGGTYQTLAEAKEAGAVTLNYGVFINQVLDFLIIALVLFILIKQIARLKKKNETVIQENTKECPYCFTQIPIKATRCPFCTSELKK
ncbi:large conductance mechanosensitive channel protein MscL [bacterium]|nr:large conductance mechanosensitive channel protein MscL [bacterium]